MRCLRIRSSSFETPHEHTSCKISADILHVVDGTPQIRFQRDREEAARGPLI